MSVFLGVALRFALGFDCASTDPSKGLCLPETPCDAPEFAPRFGRIRIDLCGASVGVPEPMPGLDCTDTGLSRGLCLSVTPGAASWPVPRLDCVHLGLEGVG